MASDPNDYRTQNPTVPRTIADAMEAARRLNRILEVAPDGRRQLSLGEFVAQLAKLPPERDVYIDYACLAPMKLDSYRGYYDHIALGFTTEEDAPTVQQLLEHARQNIGAVLSGYKGGDFTMGEPTPLWLSNRGRVADVIIVGVRDDKWAVIIETRLLEEKSGG